MLNSNKGTTIQGWVSSGRNDFLPDGWKKVEETHFFHFFRGRFGRKWNKWNITNIKNKIHVL